MTISQKNILHLVSQWNRSSWPIQEEIGQGGVRERRSCLPKGGVHRFWKRGVALVLGKIAGLDRRAPELSRTRTQVIRQEC